MGVNLIFGDKKSSPAAVGIKIAIVIVGFALVLFGDFAKRHKFWNGDQYGFNMDMNDDNDDDNNDNHNVTKVEGNSEYLAPYTDSIKIARLNISGGGAVYTLSDTTNELFSATTREFKGKYVYSHSRQDSVSELNFKMQGHSNLKFNFGSKNHNARNNEAIFKLNTKPEWEINIKAGAAKLDFDLSKFKVRSLNVAGGAADFEVKLGQPLANTNVNVETGMSSTTIRIPNGAACHIKSSTGLSSTSFDGFDKKEDGNYETPGFAGATNKLHIKISGGMADFKVERY
ncbi:hypothetical protein [Mucilaginibacter antarcticus]|uniref:hypothetical protein n=1 Tax=Mucilaginibacter antarcticus TaxID=1855725 RepID=UPI00362BA52F